MGSRYIRWFEELGMGDVGAVGGKNASLGEMIRNLTGAGIRVPDGFATTVDAYRRFLDGNGLAPQIEERLRALEAGETALESAGESIRALFLRSEFPEDISSALRQAYRELCDRHTTANLDVAVRSSATAEDLPGASFAGQQESFLNVVGEDALIESCRRCFASLFTDRAITYRREMGFAHMKVGLSVGVQRMVHADGASAGVMFSVDTESGFPNVVVINAAWGLGESVVQGAVIPDQYMAFKPLLANASLTPVIDKALGSKESKVVYGEAGIGTATVPTTAHERQSFVLTDGEILQLARWAVDIEQHYGTAMDMEWAKDANTGELFIVQARPETVISQRTGGAIKSYRLLDEGPRLLSGLSIGEAIATGPACVIAGVEDISRFVPGSILVAKTTSPDWVPIMKQAAAIVTDHGGRTSHAAIVSRELGVPAVVGTGNATSVLQDGQPLTVSCAEGEKGFVYEGALDFAVQDVSYEDLPRPRTQIMMNIADPAVAFHWWQLPCQGIGLARMEFIITSSIKVHPMALLEFEKLTDAESRSQIEELTRGYDDRAGFFVDRLAWGMAKIAASRYPDPVIMRTSDFKTNEYANLIGGRQFEPVEENPMIGFRGASRYYSERYRAGFGLECRAIRRVREEMGLTNLVVMIPFCRTLEEADQVLGVMAENGLVRGEKGLEVYVMAEIPSNVLMAEEFAQRFDGFSIGSNDLTQLVLGVDRDAEELAHLFDERNPAVKRMIAELIELAHSAGSKVGICGQAPSDYPDFAAWLVELGIDSISLNPDSVVEVLRRVVAQETQASTGLAAAATDGIAKEV
jgi:pyruvate,water dikinase